jgi:hypothetical protein
VHGLRLGLVGSARVIAGGLLLALGDLALLGIRALGLAGSVLVPAGLGEACARLDALLVRAWPAAPRDQERGQHNQQHHNDRDEHPSHAAGLPTRRRWVGRAMLDIDTAVAWRGRTVRDRDGEKVGTFGSLQLEGDNDRPAYVGVKTGLFRSQESIAPLDGAREGDDGDIHLPYALDAIKAAPNVDPDVALNDDEEGRLRAHYGEPTQMRRETAEMIRSEEEVDVKVEPAKPKERVRLRKYTVTEHVEKTVPVRREEVRIENDPPETGRVVRVEDVD